VLQALLGSLAPFYMRGAMMGYQGMSQAFKTGNVVAPNFNNLYAEVMRNGKVSVELKDLKNLEKVLREVAPDLATGFKRNIKKVGNPARDEMRKTFRKIDKRGPLWNKRGNRPGRTYDSMYSSFVSNISWYQTRFQTGNKGIAVNYKNRKAASDLAKLKRGTDGTLSIVRILVKPPAYVMADISGRGTRRKATGTLSREYRIHAFGQVPHIMRRHKVNAESVQKWIEALGSGQNKISSRPSRYAYPTLEKHSTVFAQNVTTILNSTITELNRRMGS
jgi:hypothetical protein